MGTTSRKTLKTFVYRTLIVRLVVASMIIALVFGALAFVSGYRQISTEVTEDALNRIDILRLQTRDILSAQTVSPIAAFRQALAHDPDIRLRQRYGDFIYTLFYDAGAKAVGEFSDASNSGSQAARQMIRSAERIFPADTNPWSRVVDLAGQRFIRLVTAVSDTDGRVQGYADIMFAVAPEALQRLRGDVLVTVIYVGLIVLTAALLLYPVIVTLTRRLAHFSNNLLDSHMATLAVLGSAIAKRDSDTDAHNYRVTIYAVRLAEALGLPTADIRRLIKGAFLHDVGKIGIRDDILLKPGRLSEEEYAIMKTHVHHGLDIVDRSAWLADARDVVGGHHEKYDGSGYPQGLAADQIPDAARIFAIADVFDALSSQRPYKTAFDLEKSMAILAEGGGSHFDPQFLEVFGTIAADLHRRYAETDGGRLQQALERITVRYFSSGLETLMYT